MQTTIGPGTSLVRHGVHFTLGASFAERINSLQQQHETDLRRFPPSRRRATWGRGSRKFICPYPICPKTEMLVCS
jgi:hypothetical protein